MNDGSRRWVVTAPLTAPSSADSARTASAASQGFQPSRISSAPTTIPMAYMPPTDRSTSRMASANTVPHAIRPT